MAVLNLNKKNELTGDEKMVFRNEHPRFKTKVRTSHSGGGVSIERNGENEGAGAYLRGGYDSSVTIHEEDIPAAINALQSIADDYKELAALKDAKNRTVRNFLAEAATGTVFVIKGYVPAVKTGDGNASFILYGVTQPDSTPLHSYLLEESEDTVKVLFTPGS